MVHMKCRMEDYFISSVNPLSNPESGLYSFIRLADYLVVNTMHALATNSVSTLLSYLAEQLANTPAAAEIKLWMEAVSFGILIC